ncbi:hypothetical protein BDV19DRAFT_78025 [Aspergillus venezuelensis]
MRVSGAGRGKEGEGKERGSKAQVVENEGNGRLTAHRSCILRPIASAIRASRDRRRCGEGTYLADDEGDRCCAQQHESLAVLRWSLWPCLQPRSQRWRGRNEAFKEPASDEAQSGLLWSSASLEVVRLSLFLPCSLGWLRAVSTLSAGIKKGRAQSR